MFGMPNVELEQYGSGASSYTLNGSRTSPGYGKTGRMVGTGQGSRFSLSGRYSGAVQSSATTLEDISRGLHTIVGTGP